MRLNFENRVARSGQLGPVERISRKVQNSFPKKFVQIAVSAANALLNTRLMCKVLGSARQKKTTISTRTPLPPIQANCPKRLSKSVFRAVAFKALDFHFAVRLKFVELCSRARPGCLLASSR